MAWLPWVLVVLTLAIMVRGTLRAPRADAPGAFPSDWTPWIRQHNKARAK